MGEGHKGAPSTITSSLDDRCSPEVLACEKQRQKGSDMDKTRRQTHRMLAGAYGVP